MKKKLIDKVIEFEELCKTANPLDTKDSQHFGKIAQEIINMIKEDPEAAKNEDLREYSEGVQKFLIFLKSFTLTTQV
jgi:gamma-glutamyltranspeptidase